MKQSWDTEVTCGQTVPTGECEGKVRVWGYYDPGSMYGGPERLGSPPEGEDNVGKCSVCGFEDWSEEERDEMTNEAQGICAGMDEDPGEPDV